MTNWGNYGYMSSLERKWISAILNHNRHRHRRRRNHNDNIQHYYVWATAASADLFHVSLVARRSVDVVCRS